MSDRLLLRRASGRPGTARPFALISWYGLMGLVGFGFGGLADRRPFGENFLVQPLPMFCVLVGLGVLALRVLLARPVPGVISDRALIAGCLFGLAMFIAGNFLSVQLLPLN